MSNVRFDELELMLMAMFEQPTLKDTIQVLLEVQPLVAEDAEMAALVQQTIPKMQRLTEPQFKGCLQSIRSIILRKTVSIVAAAMNTRFSMAL